MSLEAKLDTLNTLLANVITILQTGVSGQRELDLQPQADGAAIEAAVQQVKRTRAKKDAAAEAETVYWSIPSLNSFFAQESGMGAPTTADAVRITKGQYDLGKSQISARVDAVLASQQPKPTSASSETPPAPSQPTAEAAVGAAQGQSTGQPAHQQPTAANAGANSACDVTFAQVLEAARALNASKAEGHGRQAVLDVVKALLPDDPQPTVTKLQTTPGVDMALALKVFSEKLNPPAAAEPELF